MRRYELADTEFALIETMRLDHGVIPRLNRHLARMEGSARYFSYPWHSAVVRQAVDEATLCQAAGMWRLRLTVDRHGTPSTTCTEYSHTPDRVWRVSMASSPIDHTDPFLFNKTTRRSVYDLARADHPDVDDVLLWNERGEVTESTIANVVTEIDGRRYTPPVECGLLPGTLRAELIEQGEIFERHLTVDDLRSAARIWLINSLRGWVAVQLVE